ncbi:MAG TPA: LamG-like jellyroll fold domain-containing protein, partial [Pseudonocardiaceae bacterium]|nr:LamG-like jellyroll fold domain-containing protein [Pseudonocardiaceae bacterium]
QSPVVLSGGYGDRAVMPMPRLDTTSVRRTAARPMTFHATADGQDVTLTPIARTHHQHYTVYWLTGAPPPPPPAFAAWYRFDETSGTTAADSSGNAATATLVGGTSWTTGRLGGAVALDGTSGYVRLPDGVVNGATAYSVATWVNLRTAPMWSRVFDFGTGTTAYMFLTPASGDNTLRYAITSGGAGGEQQINASPLPTGSWQHVAVTYAEGTGILYVNGVEVGRNTAMSVQPVWFGNDIKQNYLGKSQYADPYLAGALDDFRLYGRALTPDEVAALAAAAG